MKPVARPVHRQFGSKGRVAPQLLAMVPPGKRIWCELFAGTAAVTLAKRPHPEEHLNDLNGEIFNLFCVLRDEWLKARLIDMIALTPWAEQEYKACKTADPTGDPVERARRYLVLSWQGINGVCAKGTSWASFDGGSKPRTKIWQSVPERISIAAERLKDVCLHNKHAIDLLERIGRYENGVVFIDPPYPPSTLYDKRPSYAVMMDRGEHEDLAKSLQSVKCSVILTMNPGTVYDEILGDWHQSKILVQGLTNKIKEELVFTNFKPPVSFKPPADLFADEEA